LLCDILIFYFNYISFLPTPTCCSEKKRKRKKEQRTKNKEKRKKSSERTIIETLLYNASEQKGELKMLSFISVFHDHRITESQNSRDWKGPLWVI